MSSKLFGQSKFEFIGSVVTGKELITVNQSDKSPWVKTRINIGIKDDANSQYLNIEDFRDSTKTTCNIYTKEGKLEEVALADTTSPKVMDMAADFTKTTIDLETDFDKKKEYMSLIFKVRNHEFENDKLLKQESLTEADKAKIAENIEKIAAYKKEIAEKATNRVQFCHPKDVIQFLEAAADAIKDLKLRVTGNVKSNFYNGKNRLQYVPTLIEVVPNDTPNELTMVADIFFDQTSVEDVKKEKKIVVNGYIGERVKKADRLFPVQVVVDYSKIDETKALDMSLLEFMKDSFKTDKKKFMYKNQFEIEILNGAKKVEFDESCLTEAQKRAVSLGVASLEDYRPKGNVYGDRVQELNILRPTLKGEFTNGVLEAFEVKELDNYLVSDDSDVKAADIKVQQPVEHKAEETEAPNPMEYMKGLFGSK